MWDISRIETFDLEDPHQQDDHEDQQEHSTTDIHGSRTSFATYTAGTEPALLETRLVTGVGGDLR